MARTRPQSPPRAHPARSNSTQGDDSLPQSIRIELSSENDLFFHYMHVLDESGFRLVQEQQKLMVEFVDYPNVLISMLNNTIKEPST